MKITSYNITDVGYLYIGLRILAGLPQKVGREEQMKTISRSILKYVSDKALRLMLPEPKGTFGTVGEKVCHELVHLQLARSVQGAFEITDAGREVLELLDQKKHLKLRRLIASIHLQTYDNLRSIVQRHLEVGYIWLPIVETSQLSSENYLVRLLKPIFEESAAAIASELLNNIDSLSPKKIENALHERILRQVFCNETFSVPLFRAISDRLVSLRLLNIMKYNIENSEFAKSYSPCVATSPPHNWYIHLNIPLPSGELYSLYFCEPNMVDQQVQEILLKTVNEAFLILSQNAGYYDLPDVRDFVCDQLKIPEAAFDEGINCLLDLQPSPLTVGLHYEGISARRKPLTRTRETTQIYNLIRRT